MHLILLQFAVMLVILAPKIPNLKRPGDEFDFVLCFTNFELCFLVLNDPGNPRVTPERVSNANVWNAGSTLRDGSESDSGNFAIGQGFPNYRVVTLIYTVCGLNTLYFCPKDPFLTDSETTILVWTPFRSNSISSAQPPTIEALSTGSSVLTTSRLPTENLITISANGSDPC